MESVWLGVPDRVDPVMQESTVNLTPRLRAPGDALLLQSADSLGVICSGGVLRLPADIPSIPAIDIHGVRFRWRGTLGGKVGLAWRETTGTGFRRSLDRVAVPGGAREIEVELGFGPTRILGPNLPEVAIDLPATEVGPVYLADVRLLLRPGRTLARVDLDGDVREALAPASGCWIEWDFVVPAAGRVEFEYATHPTMRVSHGDGTRFRAELKREGKTTVLLDRWLSVFANPGHRGWQAARLDLSSYAGERVTLRLSSRAGPEASGLFPASSQVRDDFPLFTVPRVVGGRDHRPNVLLIVIDTLRRDALGAWGGGPSPVLDSLATAGVRFERAWATGSWTHPSTASILSGWRASEHGLGYGPAGTTRLNSSTPMIAEQFRDAGWATAAVSNNQIVSVRDGFGRGFSAFDERAFTNDELFGGRRVTASALEWLGDDPGGPYFLYLHYFDPHGRYQAPPPFTRMYVDPSADRQVEDSAVRAGRPNPFVPEVTETARALTEVEIQYMRDLYRGEVRYVDHCIGRLLAGMRRAGRLENTIVVVTSDHGEEFLEHGGLKHAHTLYEELVAVPLLVCIPGGENAATVRPEPVSLLDLAASLRALAGLASLPGDRPWWPASRAGSGPLVAENWHDGDSPRDGLQRTLIDWPHKFVHYGGGLTELFDLQSDPWEQEARDDPERLTRMRAALDSLSGLAPGDTDPASVDPDLLERLKAMGYVH